MLSLTRIRNALLHRVRFYKARGQQIISAGSRALYSNKRGVNLIGYFSYTSGVAEVGRFFARFTKFTETPFVIYGLHAPGYKKLDPVSLQAYQYHFSDKTKFYKNIFFVNADQIPHLKQYSPLLFAGRYNTAVFFWEFNDYFDFPDAFKAVQEVIAFTDFIVTAVQKVAPPQVRVTKFPFPFSQNWTIRKTVEHIRSQLKIEKDEFVFTFNFDFYSVYQRKNPEAIIEAFDLAFSDTDKVRLILKTIHADTKDHNFLSFQQAVNQMQLKQKLIVINENLDRDEFMGIINASDCYVSLHRSEGLGLGMLEAMSMGKPVIGTNFGGNTDFMDNNNSMPVGYKLIPVTEGAGPYKAGWLWGRT